ncbi:hypothetical protein ABPG74_020196 [Tetrahymena malaccensis]
MKAIRQSVKFSQKLAKLKENQQTFDYNLIDFQHPDFNNLESKCLPVQGFTQTLKSEILNLKYHVELSGRVNLAANQIGIPKRFIVMVKPDYLQKRVWVNDNLDIQNLHALVNPRILDKDKFMEYDWEQTACFPTVRFRRLRYHHILVQYLNEQMEQVEVEMNGWESRLFQQSLDHLNGIIPFDEVKNMLDFELLPEYNDEKLILDEFNDFKLYRLFGKEKQISLTAQKKGSNQSNYGPSSIPETINEVKQDQPKVFQNKTKKQKPQSK